MSDDNELIEKILAWRDRAIQGVQENAGQADNEVSRAANIIFTPLGVVFMLALLGEIESMKMAFILGVMYGRDFSNENSAFNGDLLKGIKGL